jgi:KDO2-lipid IV(A) lauroyltransferase
LIDQDTKVESIPVSFFGQAAKTPVSLITLGKKSNARFVSAFLFRTGWFRFTVFVEQIPDGTTEEDILRVYNERLEQYIRRYPDQWVWFHKRWRTTPQGVTLSSKEYAAVLEARIKNRA